MNNLLSEDSLVSVFTPVQLERAKERLGVLSLFRGKRGPYAKTRQISDDSKFKIGVLCSKVGPSNTALEYAHLRLSAGTCARWRVMGNGSVASRTKHKCC